ncbi:MAG: leucine-rich repeat domain-containing protein, partial [Bacilli bacterium]|nr:leucine-rich repeat domain-containing protein [Bacilli bacterium]
SAGINLEKTWPISDFDGMQLEGYTFTVTNYCDTPQDYRIDLDRLVDSEGRKEMSNEYLATLLDYGVPVMYDELETGETTVEDVKEKRVLAYDTVAGKVGNEPGSNTHTLRLWIDEESPVSEQGSTFLSRVEINAGQGIEKYYTPEECFTFDESTGSITAYDVSCGGTDVVIPYNINNVAVTQIGASAFREKGLTSVEFPRSVTTIGNMAVMGNQTLEKIIFKNGLLSIGQRAFAGINNATVLTFISLPDSLTTIGLNAFMKTSIKQLIIPDNVNSLEANAFISSKIENLIIGKGIKEIGNHTFRHNEIKKVVIPDNITSIGQYSFGDNPIEEITFGTGVTSIGTVAFASFGPSEKYYNQNFLSEIFIPSNITTLETGVFKDTTSDVIIRTERTKADFLENVTTSSSTALGNWYGNAQVISSDNLYIYE